MEKKIFRQKNLDRISSPEELNSYLRVSSVGVWVVLLAVIVLLAGILVWAGVGTLNTKVEAVATIANGEVEAIVSGANSEKIQEGMIIEIDGNQGVIDSVRIDEYGRALAKGLLNLKDGKYKAEIIIESIKPLSFLIR